MQPRHADRAHRSRSAEAQGHHVLQVRHDAARRRDPAAARDDGPRDVQRGVHRRRARARRRHDRRPQQRLGRRRTRRSWPSAPGLGTGGSGAVGHRVPGSDRGPARATASATTSARSAPAAPAAAVGRAASGSSSWRRSSARTTTRSIRQKLAQLYTLQQIGRILGAAHEVARAAHRRRAEHREADDERPAPAPARSRQRDHRRRTA